MSPGTRDGHDAESNMADMKELRREHPSGWLHLTHRSSVVYLIDALLDAPPRYEFNKSEISRRSGVSRESVRKHIDLLVDLGILDSVEGTSPLRYRLNDSGRVTRVLFELNGAINAVLAGQDKTLPSGPSKMTLPSYGSVHGVGAFEFAEGMKKKLVAVGG